MIRRRLVQSPPRRKRRSASESFARQAIPRSESIALEIPDQQKPEIDSRRQTRPPPPLCIKPPAPPLHELVEVALLQQLVQALIERMTRTLRQRSLRNPHLFLLLLILPCSHRHVSIIEHVH